MPVRSSTERRSVFNIEQPEYLFPLVDTRYSDTWLVGVDLEYWAATRRDDELAFFADKLLEKEA